MSISKFRYNKRRKHYSYSFKKNNSRVKNILLTSKPVRKEHLDVKENINYINILILTVTNKLI